MEEVCAYYQRLDPDLAMTVLRLGVVVPEGTPPVPAEALTRIEVPFCSLATIAVEDVLGILEKALDLGPGFRRWNAVAAWMPSPLPVRDALVATLGARSNQLDLSAYSESGPTSLYDIAEVLRTTGYPRINPGRPRS
jgi:hypothetical protein